MYQIPLAFASPVSSQVQKIEFTYVASCLSTQNTQVTLSLAVVRALPAFAVGWQAVRIVLVASDLALVSAGYRVDGGDGREGDCDDGEVVELHFRRGRGERYIYIYI